MKMIPEVIAARAHTNIREMNHWKPATF